MKIALTIAGSDSGGGAGIQADLKTFHQFGVHGTSVIVALTAQNTQGVLAVEAASPAIVAAQLDALAADLPPDALKTGMLATAALVRQVVETFGRLDVVVNSASVMEAMPLGEVTASAWDAVMNLNLRAPFLVAQEAARHLPDGGSIINIADLAAFETWARFVPHGVSKSGLVYLTRALASLLAPRIRVNAVAPGTVLLPDWIDPATADRWVATTPLRRHGTPDDVVQAIRYLLGATYVTGETIIVDGGRQVRR